MDGMENQRRWQVIVGILCWTISGLGCMSFNLGNTYERTFPSSYVDSTGLLRQHDETTLPKTTDNHYTIHYPRAFASKPHLKFLKTAYSLNPKDIEIVEQLPDRFTIRWTGNDNAELVAWQAEGMPSLATSPPPTVTENRAELPVKGER